MAPRAHPSNVMWSSLFRDTEEVNNESSSVKGMCCSRKIVLRFDLELDLSSSKTLFGW